MEKLIGCRWCGRDRGAATCMNTRDMDPDDGFNRDPVCNQTLVRIGGGERRRTMKDIEAGESHGR